MSDEKKIPLYKQSFEDIEYYVGRFLTPKAPTFKNVKITKKTPTFFKNKTLQKRQIPFSLKVPLSEINPLKKDAIFDLVDGAKNHFSGESDRSRFSHVIIEMDENSKFVCYPAWLYKFKPAFEKFRPAQAEIVADRKAIFKNSKNKNLPLFRKTLLSKIDSLQSDLKSTKKSAKKSAAKNKISGDSDVIAMDDLLFNKQMGADEGQAEETGEYRLMNASDDEIIEEEGQNEGQIAPFSKYLEEESSDEDFGRFSKSGPNAKSMKNAKNYGKRISALLSGRISLKRLKSGKETKSAKDEEGNDEDLVLTDISDENGDEVENLENSELESDDLKISKKDVNLAKERKNEFGTLEMKVAKAIFDGGQIGAVELIRSLGLAQTSGEAKQQAIQAVKKVAVMKEKGGKKFFELKPFFLEALRRSKRI